MLLNDELLAIFPKDVLIPIDAVTDVAMQTILNSEMEDSKGVQVAADKFHSQAIHVTGKGFYFIDQPDLNDDEARATWDCMMGWRWKAELLEPNFNNILSKSIYCLISYMIIGSVFP